MSRFLYLIALLGLFFIATPALLKAEEQPSVPAAPEVKAEPTVDQKPAPAVEPKSTATLSEVVVTATRTPEETRNLSQNVTVVDLEEIEHKQARTPIQMLREEPGIWTNQVTAQGSPIVRGQIGNRVLYMWDGIRINNGALFGGPNGFFNQFPVGAVERMEVIRGPGAVQYGSDAIGGVINILSKQGEFTDKREVGGEVYSRYGSADNERTETADFRISDKKYAFAGGVSKQDVDDSYRAGGGEKLGPSGFNSLGGYANLAFRPVEDQTFRASWIQNRRDDVEVYVQSKLNANGIPRLFTPTERRGIVKLDYTTTDHGPISKELKVYAYDQYYDAQRDRRVDSTKTFSETSTLTHQEILGGGVQNVSNLGPHKFTYGLDYRSEDLASELDQNTLTKATNTSKFTHPAGKTPDGTYDVFDAFAMSEFKVSDSFKLSAGVRLERNHLNSNPEANDVIPKAGYTINDLTVDKHWDSATWNVGGLYNITSQWDVAGNISTGFRAPTFSDLLSAGPPVFSSKTASVPSPDLTPEKSLTYEIGPRYHGEHFSFSLTSYWTKLDDVIVSQTGGTVTIPGQGDYTASRNQNAGYGYTRGMEFSFAYKPAKDWTLFGNSTYTRSQDESIGKPFRFTPPAFGTFGLRYEASNKRWFAEAVELFADRLRRHAPNDELDAGFSTDPAYGSPNTTNNLPYRRDYKLPGWATTNLRAGVTVWREGHRSFEITLDVNNVLDAQYREAYSQQQKLAPGINAVIGGRLKF